VGVEGRRLRHGRVEHDGRHQSPRRDVVEQRIARTGRRRHHRSEHRAQDRRGDSDRVATTPEHCPAMSPRISPHRASAYCTLTSTVCSFEETLRQRRQRITLNHYRSASMPLVLC